MSNKSSTPKTNQKQPNTNENNETQTAAMATLQFGPPPQPFDPATIFMEAYDCAKKNNNWNKVLSSLLIHPEWLTKIPDGRNWTMLHQIVYSGNVAHLNEVLALQTTNGQFRLLCETVDQKTVREIAADHAHSQPEMMRRIERLVTLDQLLDHATGCKWELLRQVISQQPDIVNEKPPYHRYYLAHHLAYMGQLDIFKDLSNICQFKLNLLVDNKTINQIAREHNHIEFAEYIERLDPYLIQMTQNKTNNNNHDDNQTTLLYPSINNEHTQMTDKKEDTYEKTVIDNIAQISRENLLNSITCCITQAVLYDPVMAADGFTYEREAILNWFQHSNRSPMTNQELDNLEIKPNFAIKSIIQLLQNANNLSAKSDKK